MCVNELVIVETIERALVRDRNGQLSYVYFHPFNIKCQALIHPIKL